MDKAASRAPTATAALKSWHWIAIAAGLWLAATIVVAAAINQRGIWYDEL